LGSRRKPPLLGATQLGFGAIVAVLLVVGIIAYRSISASRVSGRWAQHTNEVLEHLANQRLSVRTIESGYRDFALSGEDQFIQVSRDSVSFLYQEDRTLRALMADNAGQLRRLDLVTNLVERMVKRGDTRVQLRRAGDAQAAAVVQSGQGDPLLDEFRIVARDLGDEEHRLLHERNAEAEQRYRETKAALIVGSALALLIAGLSFLSARRDHMGRKGAEDTLRRLDRLYAMVSGITALGVRVRDRDDLFKNACRIAVEHGEFEMAWIALVDRTETKIVPMAWAGLDEQAMAAIKDLFSTSEGTLEGRTLAAQAIRKKAPVVSNDVENDEGLIFGNMHAASGVRSIAVLPLLISDKAVGVFALYTNKLEYFDGAGLTLLMELAGNVAFAIDHIEKQERLDHFAYYDALTGLANRSLFLDRLTQHMLCASSNGHKLAVFLIDLERFKKFNDNLGRPAGDALLKQVAEWLVRNAGNVSTLARVDADHFAIVLPEVTNEADLVRLLEKTNAAFLTHPFRVNDVEYRMAVKVGVALFPDDGGDADTVFKNAEAALKKAKVSGDRYLFYAQKMTDTVVGSFGIENRLRQALENGEFVLHYQPKVNLASGMLTGAEALIRWNDPKTGLVPPARFVPILEETRLIHEVGRWALGKAIEDYQRWRRAGLPAVRIAVNVSPLQLRSQSFVAEVEEAIRVAGDAACGLELEITESLIMEDVNHSIASLRAIRALGVTVAIDDFGTGFSSLSYLSKLPVDTLKIDRSFIVDMVSGEGGLTLVSVIINLAHALKLNVVAEGVETEEQLHQLRLLHCDEMQGYLFGKPVAVEIFEKQYLTPVAAAREDTNRLIAAGRRAR
jgi:diguanylate cyclase (GGDEF)-like protein